MTTTLLVLCESEAAALQWRARAGRFADARVEACAAREAWHGALRAALAAGNGSVIVCREQTWLQDDVAARAREVAADLDRRFPNWSLCGDAGVAPDGVHRYHHIKDDRRGPEPGAGPRPVLALDGNLMLANTSQWQAAGAALPALSDFDAIALAASLEGLAHGLLPMTDASLGSVIAGTNGSERHDPLLHEPLVEYLRAYAVRAPAAEAGAESGFYARLSQAAGVAVHAELLRLFDAALTRARGHRKPRILIGCRSQFDRAPLLDRAVASFSQAAQAAGELAAISVRILSDLPETQFAAEVARVKALHPVLDLDGWHLPVREKRLSRVDLLLGAIRRTDADFIWFVDDDDYVYPQGACALARTVAAGSAQLVVGASAVFDETWVRDASGAARLQQAVHKYRRPAADVFGAPFENNTPICSMVLPVATARGRIEGIRAASEYYEDYLLLMLVLPTPGLQLDLIEEDLCGISLRAGENTVTAPDRTVWNESLANVLADVLPRGGNSFPWQLSVKAREEISNLTAELARRTHALVVAESERDHVKAELAHAMNAFNDTKARLDAMTNRFVDTNTRLAESTRELHGTKARLDATEHDVKRITGSRSWRWTAPLRDGSAWLHRVSSRVRGRR